MRVLLSAYACEPHKGSEPAVGWNWLLALARRGDEVSVLTRSNNRPAIEAALIQQSETASIRLLDYDLPRWCMKWKGYPGGLYLYYLLWQIGASRLARRHHRLTPFDLVHHITFVTFRQPSFMGALGIPFVLGPVGGGESSPKPLRRSLPWFGKLQEFVRDLLIGLVRFDPMMRFTFAKAVIIACTTEQTRSRVPRAYQSKTLVLPAIGIASDQIGSGLSGTNAAARGASACPPKFLFVGRLLHWKGLHLLLRALPEVLMQLPGAELTVVGNGRDAEWLHGLASCSRVAAQVTWIDHIQHHEVADVYRAHTALIFPSLHDSGGLVVLESLAEGVPVICLDLGGPGALVNSSCGIVIGTQDRSEEQVVEQLAAAMVQLAQRAAHGSLAQACRSRSNAFTWDRAAHTLYAQAEVASLKGLLY